MGLFNFILGITEEIENDKKKKMEKEMEYHYLEEDEKELVRKGYYEPHNFEYFENDEDLEDDDYYSDR